MSEEEDYPEREEIETSIFPSYRFKGYTFENKIFGDEYQFIDCYFENCSFGNDCWFSEDCEFDHCDHGERNAFQTEMQYMNSRR